MPKIELHKVGVIDPSSLTDTVVFSTMLEGGEFATRSFIETEDDPIVIEDGQPIKEFHTRKLTVGGVPNSAVQTQLDTFVTNKTKVTIVGKGLKDNVIIENALLSYLESRTGHASFQIQSSRSGRKGYDENGKLDTEFMVSKNLLAMHKWQEGSVAGLASGWNKSGGATSWSDVSEQQTFSTSGATVVYWYRDLYVPHLAGEEVTFSIVAGGLTTSTTGITIGIVAYDEAGSTIGSESTASADTAGLKSVTRTLPATTNSIRVRVKIGQDDSIPIEAPRLNLGTSTTYNAR